MNPTPEQVLTDDDVPVQFLNEYEKSLFKEARLGEEAIRFLESELGRLLRERATADIRDAQQQLLDADPEDAAAIRCLQQQAAVAGQFIGWISDAIRCGDDAYSQLENMR